ncbi:Universal stress protein A-like protein [Drosera capensis]
MADNGEVHGVGAEGKKKKVMVFIDETQESYYALLWVLENLQESLISSPLLIFIAEPPPNYINSFAASFSSARLYCNALSKADLVNSAQEQERKVALGLLAKAKSICTSRGVNAVTISEVGDAKDAICAAVEKHNITLLALAEQTIGRVAGTFKWSVSDYCVQYAKCPVLVVKKTV